MSRRFGWCLWLLALAAPALAEQWDSVVGGAAEVTDPTPHWFTVRGDDIGYLVDGDTAEVKATLTLSMFSPALRPDIANGRIYTYGSFYTRTYYGERSDFVLAFDLKSATPVVEVPIPPKSAGIGHSGMIGLIDGRFIGVWNITPATSVSIVDTSSDSFVGEISTPGCAAVYPVGRGFLMPCGDGALQYIALDDKGAEAARHRSKAFFSVEDDPVFDYAVPTAGGWLFLTMDGQVFEATWTGKAFSINEPWSIFDEEDAAADQDEAWRIGGNQPFAYNATTGLLTTLMHQGGGQETFEEAGTEVWAFNVAAKRRGYRLKLEAPAGGLQLTADESPLLVLSPDYEGEKQLRIYDAVSGRLLRTMEDMDGGLIQNL